MVDGTTSNLQITITANEGSCDYFAGLSLYSWRVDTVLHFNWGSVLSLVLDLFWTFL